MKEIVSFSMVMLSCCDSQHCALLWMEIHLPLGFPDSSRAVRLSCNLMESPLFLWGYKGVSSANKLACEDKHMNGRSLM